MDALPAADAVTAPRSLWGRDLRYVLTMHLFESGPRTVEGLVAAVRRAGFEIDGRPSKTVSDALRWEVARGRVVRLARGRYGPGSMPRSTRAWIRSRVTSLPSPR